MNTYRIQFAIALLVLISVDGQIAFAQQAKRPLADRLAAEDVQQLAQDAREKGDAKRGAIAFHQRRVTCTQCHANGEEKPLLGPDIANLGKKVSDAYLIESVLHPSKEIAKNFESVIVITSKGNSIVGLSVKSDDKGVVLRDPASSGKTQFVPRANIDEEIKSKVSVMPTGLVNALADRQQFLDLIRYLMEVSAGGKERAIALRPDPALYAEKPASQPSGEQDEFDAVAEGKRFFETTGCVVCHVVAKDDVSLKSGPSLNGLFTNKQREREVGEANSTDRKKVVADKAYFLRSVRKAWDELAVAESGPTKGAMYLPIMPMYQKEVVADQDLEAVWHYLRTLADADQAGPASVTLKRQKRPVPKNHLEIPGETVVTTRARVFRAPLRNSSGRALHVGLANGMSYTFDPRMLSVRRIWSGGFLNLKPERSGRGNGASIVGQGAIVFLDKEAVLTPLTSKGKPVDFEFKEPDVQDYAAVEKHVWDGIDFKDAFEDLNAEYLGHQLESQNGEPSFRFRVGENQFSETVGLTNDGRIEITINAILMQPQQFKLRDTGLTDVEIDGGEFVDGVWSLPKTDQSAEFRLRARYAGGLVARSKIKVAENWASQPLVVEPAKGTKMPAGYAVENWQAPLDLYGRKQLFEPTGIAVAKDGTIVVATRAAGVWRIRDNQWTLFAEGAYECLGVWIEDERGDQIVVAQKPELTRMIDRDSDGRAEVFETVCDDYGFHANYHEYTHGPVRDKEGNYYFTLNLSHGGNERASWRAGGPYMGSMGGYRGWACRVTPAGKFEPYAFGLRSPAGLGFDPDGRLWYAENQGEYVGSSKLVPLEKDKFYGHLSGLIDLPGMIPEAKELHFDRWKDKLRKGAVWLPHGQVANSPGNPAWDVTGGTFGPYQGQMFIGDQTLSKLLRVVTEKVNGVDQGSVVLFADKLASGVMRPCFLPDGSLLIGQTGRGWGSRGGNQASLQRIIWDGKTVAGDLSHVTAGSNGLVVHFTQPLGDEVTEEELSKLINVQSWFYTNTQNYGSPQHDKRTDSIQTVSIATDRRSAVVKIVDFGKGTKWLDRIYQLQLKDSSKLFGDAPTWGSLEVYFTLRAIP